MALEIVMVGELVREGAPRLEWGSLPGGSCEWSGVGEEIRCMSCWICYSEYVITAVHVSTPSLRDLDGHYND